MSFAFYNAALTGWHHLTGALVLLACEAAFETEGRSHRLAKWMPNQQEGAGQRFSSLPEFLLGTNLAGPRNAKTKKNVERLLMPVTVLVSPAYERTTLG